MLCVCVKCVKALVYYDVQTCRLDLQNEKGDTALHMAARWGYEGIIQVLLENGASTNVPNKSKDSPLHCALNTKVSSTHGEETNQINTEMFRTSVEYIKLPKVFSVETSEILRLASPWDFSLGHCPLTFQKYWFSGLRFVKLWQKFLSWF